MFVVEAYDTDVAGYGEGLVLDPGQDGGGDVIGDGDDADGPVGGIKGSIEGGAVGGEIVAGNNHGGASVGATLAETFADTGLTLEGGVGGLGAADEDYGVIAAVEQVFGGAIAVEEIVGVDREDVAGAFGDLHVDGDEGDVLLFGLFEIDLVGAFPLPSDNAFDEALFEDGVVQEGLVEVGLGDEEVAHEAMFGGFAGDAEEDLGVDFAAEDLFVGQDDGEGVQAATAGDEALGEDVGFVAEFAGGITDAGDALISEGDSSGTMAEDQRSGAFGDVGGSGHVH